MDKPEFIKRVAEKHPQLKTRKVEQTIQVILDALCDTLARGGRIEIRGFGSFSLGRRPATQKRIPKTAFTRKEPPKYIPRFRPAKELRARASKCGEPGRTEICRQQPISPSLLAHDAANDREDTEIYA